MDTPSEGEIARTMTLVMLVAAANNDATPEQRAELKANAERLRDMTVTMRAIAERVFEIMGPDWTPPEPWIEAIEAIAGRSFR